jgi:hypothetical protein
VRHTRKRFCHVKRLARGGLSIRVLTDTVEIRHIVLIAVVKRKLHPDHAVISIVGLNALQLTFARTQVLRGEDKFKRHVELAGSIIVRFVL